MEKTKKEFIKITSCQYYCMLARFKKMLEKKYYQKDDFFNLVNAMIILPWYSHEVDEVTKELEHELYNILKNHGFYNDVK